MNNGLTNNGVETITTSGTNIFAGTRGGGVFLSMDTCRSWIAMNNGLTNTKVWSFAIKSTKIFAGTADGVFLSTDTCKNWKAVNNGLTNKDILSLTIMGKIYMQELMMGYFYRQIMEITGLLLIMFYLIIHKFSL